MNSFDLRPLRLGEILDRTFTLYRTRFVLFIGLLAIPRLISLAFGLAQIWLAHGFVTIDRYGRTQVVPQTGSGVLLSLLGVAVGIVVYSLAQGSTVHAVSELYLGRGASIAASLKRAWGNLGSLFGVVVLNGMAAVVGLVCLVIPGIYIACRLLVCVPAAMIERRGPRESLSRSWDLTRGYAGRPFVLYLLYFVLFFAIGLVAEVPISLMAQRANGDPQILRESMALNLIVNTVLSVLIEPILLIGASVFYFDLRVRKEAFDLQFMMDPSSEHLARGGQSVPSILS